MKASKYSGAQEAFILKQLEDENSRLKKIVAAMTPAREMSQDVVRQRL